MRISLAALLDRQPYFSNRRDFEFLPITRFDFLYYLSARLATYGLAHGFVARFQCEVKRFRVRVNSLPGDALAGNTFSMVVLITKFGQFNNGITIVRKGRGSECHISLNSL